MLVALDIPPGIYRNGTEYSAQGRFYAADLWRFHEGTSRPIGGWVERGNVPVTGSARAAITWMSNEAQAWTGIGTHSGLFGVSRAGIVNDITPVGFVAGRADAVLGGGYGDGIYGDGTYGTPRPGTNILPASVWSLDTWGEYLVGTMGSTIYEWRLDTSQPAQPISTAPEAEAILVTDERIMVALGSDGDPRAVDWSDAENNTDFTPTPTNLAGGRRLQTSGALKTGERIRGGYLLHTDVDVHRMTYVNLPQVYAFERLETGCGVISKRAVASASRGEVYWMGENAFWVFNGYVDAVPCDVSDYVFSDFNTLQKSKVSAWHNSLWNEVWWHYPSAESDENDRYVYFNYREKTWMIGELDRLCGVDRGDVQLPQMVDAEGVVYSHETGHLKDGRQPYLLSGPVELSGGDRTTEIHAVIPDETNLGDVRVNFRAGDYPMSPTSVVGSVQARDKTDVRFSGRRIAVEMVAKADEDFRVGRFRFDAKAGSGR